MAAVTLLGTATFSTASGTKTVTATPAVGDLIVIYTAHTGNTSAATPTDDQGGVYQEVTAAASVKVTSADQLRCFIRTQLIPAAVSTIFTHAPGTSTGGGLAVHKVTGMGRVGAAAARQAAVQNNQAAATPAPAYGSSALTGNAHIGAIFNGTNPATMTAPASWTERTDVGYATPTSGLETASRDSGFTGTTVTWGSASGSAFCSSIVELDNSVDPILLKFEEQTSAPSKLLKALTVGLLVSGTPLALQVIPNLVTRLAVSFDSQPKLAVRATSPAPNLIIQASGPVVLPFISQSLEAAPVRPKALTGPLFPSRPAIALTFPNIGQSEESAPARRLLYPTFDPQVNPPQASVVLPFIPQEFSTLPKKPSAYTSGEKQGIPPLDVNLSFGKTSLLDLSPVRVKVSQTGDSQGLPPPPVVASTTPFTSPDFQKPQARLNLSGPFFPARSIDPSAPVGPVPFVSITESYAQAKKALPAFFQYPNVTLTTDLQPVASMQWLDSAPKRQLSYSDTARGSAFIPPVVAAELPFRAPPFDAVQIKSPLKGTFFPARGLDPTAPVGSGIPFLPALDTYETRQKRVWFDLIPNLLHNTLDLPPIATEQSSERLIVRTRFYPDTSQSSPQILLDTPGTKPFFVSFEFFQPKGRILPDTSRPSPRILLDTEVLKPFAEIVWPNGVRRQPLYNLSFDSFFSPDKIPEPPPQLQRVEIDVVRKKGNKRTQTPREEILEIAGAHLEKAVEVAAPSLPKPLKPVREIVLVPALKSSIKAVALNLPEIPVEPDDSEEILELFNLGIL